MSLNASPTSLVDLHEDLIRTLSISAHAAGLEICLDIHPTMCTVNGHHWSASIDEGKWKRILTHLVQNAVTKKRKQHNDGMKQKESRSNSLILVCRFVSFRFVLLV